MISDSPVMLNGKPGYWIEVLVAQEGGKPPMPAALPVGHETFIHAKELATAGHILRADMTPGHTMVINFLDLHGNVLFKTEPVEAFDIEAHDDGWLISKRLNIASSSRLRSLVAKANKWSRMVHSLNDDKVVIPSKGPEARFIGAKSGETASTEEASTSQA